MHEMGIINYVIRDVLEVVKENNVTRVASVTLEVGELSGAVPRYLTDYWKWAVKKEPVLEGADLIIEEIKPYADSISVDNLGNLIVHKQGKNRAKSRLMLSAHMDEVGFVVTGVDDDGFADDL